MRVIQWAACALLGLALAACGGGGGGGDKSPATSISTNAASVDLVVRNLDEPPAASVSVTFKGAGLVVGTRPGETLPSWLQVEAPPTPTSPVAVTLKATNVRFEPQGVQTVVLRFVTANADLSQQVYTDVAVNLVMPHQVEPAAVAYRATQGQANAVSTQDIALQAQDINWSVVASQPWLRPERTSGTGSGALVLGVDPTGLAPGVHAAQLTVRDAAHDVDRVVDVQFIVDARELVVRRQGVALTSVGSQQHLSARVATADNAGGVSQWAASSDQAWLRLGAATGTTGQDLTVTADPSGLADGMHYAHVTLSPATAGVGGGATVTVGLYIDRARTSQPFFWMAPRDLQSPPYGYTQMLADPVRPYVYLNQSDNRIDVYNVHTGEAVGHITKGGAGWGTLTIAPDGSVLVAADIARRVVHTINPDTLALSPAIPYFRVPAAADFRMAAQIVGGRLLVATTAGDLIDVAAQQRVADFSDSVPILGSGHIAFSNDGRSLVIQDARYTPHMLYHAHVFRSGGGVGVAVSSAVGQAGAAHGVVATADDAAFVVGTDQQGWLYAGNSLTDVAAVEGMRDQAFTLFDGGFLAVDSDRETVNRYSASGVLASVVGTRRGMVYGLAVSGDQQRLLRWTNGGASEISFTDLP